MKGGTTQAAPPTPELMKLFSYGLASHGCLPGTSLCEVPNRSHPRLGHEDSGGSHVDSLMSAKKEAHVAALSPVEIVPGRWMQPCAPSINPASDITAPCAALSQHPQTSLKLGRELKSSDFGVCVTEGGMLDDEQQMLKRCSLGSVRS